MTISKIWMLVVAGIFYGLWPLLMKRSGFEAHTQSLIYALGGLAVITPWFVSQNDDKTFDLLSVGCGIAVLAAMVNGLGTIFYTKGLRALPNQQTGAGVLITLIVIVMTNETTSMLLFGSTMTLKKLLGIGSALVAFALLAT